MLYLLLGPALNKPPTTHTASLPFHHQSHLTARTPSTSSRQQPGQRTLRIRRGLLDDANQRLELGGTGIADNLVHPALARGDDNARLRAQPGERERDFLAVAAADGVGEDKDAVAGAGGVEGGLGDADVGFDADEDDAARRCW